MEPLTLDHVALWVADRDAVADVATTKLGMHVIDRTDAFTLVGADARRGKLTLFAAEGPRERGPLLRIGLRVSALDGREPRVDLGEGLEAVLVEAPTEVDYDLDHVVLETRRSSRDRRRLGVVRLRGASARRGSRSAARSSSSFPAALRASPSGRS